MSTTDDGITLHLDDMGTRHFREMVRQQLLGDYELLQDMRAGREDADGILEVADRIRVVRTLAEQVSLPEYPERRRAPRDGGTRRRLVRRATTPWLLKILTKLT